MATTDEELQKSQSILDALTGALNMSPMTIQPDASPPVPTTEETQRTEALEDDFNYARRNIKKTIDDATSNLHQLMAIARQSEHPRAFEVVSTYVNTLVSANESLMDLHKKRATAIPVPKSSCTPQIGQQNNVFVGTPDELNALLDKTHGKVIEHDSGPADRNV